jgi:hypothetical protein
MRRFGEFPRPARLAALLLAAALCTGESCPTDIGKGDSPGLYTILVSIAADGSASGGFGFGSHNPSASEFGDIVAFDSDAVNLAADGNGERDVFVRDRSSTFFSTALVSLNTDAGGLQGAERSENPSLSADGLVVAFESEARLAVGPQGSAGLPLLFVHDRFLWETRLVLATSPPVGGYLRNASVSGDGQFVAFQSNISNLAQAQPPIVPYVAGVLDQIFVADMSFNPPAITLISHAAGFPATPGNNNSRFPKITRDGSAVVFESDASDLAGATGTRQVFMGFLSGADCEIVSLHDDDTPATAFCTFPSVSYDGNLVVFRASDAGFLPGGSPCIALRNRGAASTTVLSTLPPTALFVTSPSLPAISGNGATVAFLGDEDPVNGAGFTQVWVWTAAGGTRIASRHRTGLAADDYCDRPAVSGDGRWVFWHTTAANLVTSDFNGLSDIFTRGPVQ